MTDTEAIQDSANQQFTNQAQNQNFYRPNVNPNLSGTRPQAPQIFGQNLQQGQQPQLQQQHQQLQQRPLAPPLRKVDSKQGIPIQPPANQQRPVGPSPINQQYRPSPPTGVQQQRPQPPPNWQGQQQQQQQQNRPPFPPFGGANQPQNPQVRPPFPRAPGQQPVTAPGQPPYRPPFPQQQQQQPQQQQQQPQPQQQQQKPQQQQQQQFRPTSAKALPNQNLKMSSEVAKPLANNSLINVDDDDDVVIGRASTPLKSMKPIDPMTQSQYGFLDSSKRNGLQNNDMSRNVISSYEKDNKTKPESEYKINQQNKERKDNTLNDSAFKSSVSAEHQPTSLMSNYEKQNIQKTMNISNVPTKQNENIALIRNENKQREIIKQNVPMPNPVTMNKPPVAPQSMVNKIEDNQRASVKNVTNMKNELQNKNDANKRSELLESKQKLHNKNKKGDNDSGVDESTQGNERNGPGSPGSPLKSPTKTATSRPPSATPSSKSNKSRSASRSRLLKTPEPEQVKKVPMNKIQVGNAPSPNLKAVKSKIGSLENTSYKPGGGNVKIETKKIEIKAAPRIEAKNDKYIPKGGEKKIISTKLQWNAKSKIGSLENAHHKPGGGDKKIETLKTDFKDKAKPKVGSKDNVKHVPRGGDIKENLEITNDSIQTQKLEIKAQSKVGSLDNVKHKPGGGDKKIFDDKEYLKNIEHPVAPTPPSQSPIPPSMTSSSGADENLNQQQS